MVRMSEMALYYGSTLTQPQMHVSTLRLDPAYLSL